MNRIDVCEPKVVNIKCNNCHFEITQADEVEIDFPGPYDFDRTGKIHLLFVCPRCSAKSVIDVYYIHGCMKKNPRKSNVRHI